MTDEPTQPAESPEARALLPCPFCGGPAVNVAGEYITCGSPVFIDCAGRGVHADAQDWNTRAATTARPTERGAVEALLRQAANLVYRIEAAGAVEHEGSNFDKWKATARALAPDLRAALTPPVTVAATERRAVEDYNGHSPNKYVPSLPEGCGLFAVNKTDGSFHYINHAGSWQGMPKLGRDRIAKAILDGWYEGNEEWDSPRNDMLQTRAYWAADAVLALTPPVTVAATDQAGEVEVRALLLRAGVHENEDTAIGLVPYSVAFRAVRAALDTQRATGRTMGGEDGLRKAIAAAGTALQNGGE